jgi:TetR/AcrR family transcriptional regulator
VTVRRPAADATTRILGAALAEFATHGFAAASTNTIARKARVAKGLVFHHFTSKEDLYLAVVDQVLARTTEAVFELDPMPTDLFERLSALTLQKLRVFQRDPLAYQFLMAMTEAPAALQTQLEQRREAIRVVIWPRFLEGIDATRLRPGITLTQALETLMILGYGIERQYLPQLAKLPDRGLSRIADFTREVWTHFERLRDGVYTSVELDQIRKR